VDFKKLSADRKQESPTDPFRIFQRLPKPPHINDLWESQSEALKLWTKRRKERDLVIKLNTGGGKTLVGLLIGKALLNELQRPVLYLCPNRQLVQQTAEKAAEIGIDVVTYTSGRGDLAAPFLNGESILIATYSALFHGRSKFGIRGGSGEPVELGGVICDDAHVALTDVRKAFTLSVSRQTHEALYNDLCMRFRTEFDQIGRIGSFDDIVEHKEQAVLEVPYHAWAAKASAVREHLQRNHKDDYRYQFPLLRDGFDGCHALITPGEFCITPILPMMHLFPTFAECKRRIYMSATIADDSAIVRTFDADPKAILEPIVPDTLAGVGERMVLAPSLMRFKADDRTIAESIVKEFSATTNILILVPSEHAGARWSSVADLVKGDAVDNAVGTLLARKAGRPYVFPNRYDGIDLVGDGCRLLILDGLPRAASAYYMYRSEVLRASSSLNLGLAQKVEQGLGRATRGAGDYCVVLLVGTDLTAWITRSDSLALMTSSTRAQVGMGNEISKDIDSEQALRTVIRQCLDRESGWVHYHAETLADRAEVLPVDRAAVEAATFERKYFRAITERSYPEAASIAKQQANAHSQDPRFRGWCLQMAARAAYYAQAHEESASLQREAFRANPALWLPRDTGSTYVPTHEVSKQAEAILTQIAKFSLPMGHLQDFDDCANWLTPVATSGQHEQSLKRLGEFLGFYAERPEQDHGVGPDVLWLMYEKYGLVIESKGKKKAKNALAKEDHGQLLISAKWFAEQYPDRKCVRVQVHPNANATGPAMATDTLALTFDGLGKLVSALREVLHEVCAANTTSQKRLHLCDELLRKHKLTMPDLLSTYFVPFKTIS
jgi:replicative superfamily II helicase